MSNNDGKPTVKNEGNERIGITIFSANLTGTHFSKKIDDFDVKWDPNEAGYGFGQINNIAPNTVVDLPTPLELCQTEKIDFSAKAAVGLPADSYTGTLTLAATAAGFP